MALMKQGHLEKVTQIETRMQAALRSNCALLSMGYTHS